MIEKLLFCDWPVWPSLCDHDLSCASTTKRRKIENERQQEAVAEDGGCLEAWAYRRCVVCCIYRPYGQTHAAAGGGIREGIRVGVGRPCESQE